MIFNSVKKLVDQRDFIWTLTKREVFSKYKQSILGIFWVILQPLILIAILTIVFSAFVRLPSEGVPYALFLTVAMIPWRFFNTAVNGSTKTITGFAGLIKQRSFYRPALIIVKLISETITFAFASVGIVALMIYFGWTPGINAFYALLLFCVQLIIMLGLMFLLSALNVYVRDVGFAVPLVLRLWFYMCPIIYSFENVPIQYQPYLALNPMVAILDGYRKTLLHNELPDFTMLAYSFSFGIIVLIIGWITFMKLEKNFADVI
ncbi:ABC transporter permease [Halalkalibacter kiskunsagensis]|uniref:Transport permease protein n=1 Tax=Halalkalibacter kiskunsagensis TaxID=1548599 RepID=A0ABV6KCM6_9BACI